MKTRSRSEESGARLLGRDETKVSPWVRLVSKQVQLRPQGPVEVYHCLAQSDYVAILAQTSSGLIPLVRQYRPAVESYTWELPAGLVGTGESPEEACRRELREETGLVARACTYLGAHYADTGRLENRQHAFYVQTLEPAPGLESEPGLEVAFVSAARLWELIRSGDFRHQLHLGVLMVARAAGIRLGGGEDLD